MRISPAVVGGRIDSSSPAAECSTSVTVPTSVPSASCDPKTFEFVVVELVGILRRRQRIAVDDEQRAAQGIGGGAVVDTVDVRSRSRPECSRADFTV